jgi:hypothetical protein
VYSDPGWWGGWGRRRGRGAPLWLSSAAPSDARHAGARLSMLCRHARRHREGREGRSVVAVPLRAASQVVSVGVGFYPTIGRRHARRCGRGSPAAKSRQAHESGAETRVAAVCAGRHKGGGVSDLGC